ncbi:MAG: flagellar biosynthetic protein FliR, partial [Candidatus Kapabacteria bacterium]|nr:flagellar biosynthetic protein FliR [Candidatus Kapabacteria bacterium]
MLFPDAALLNTLMAKFLVGSLLFVRVTALMFSGPVFGSLGVEPQVKVFLSAMLALVMTMAYSGSQPPITLDAWGIIPLALKEIMVGSIIGYSASLIMNAARFAGGILDFEIGFQTALLFDANAGVPTLLGELKSMMITMIFLFLNGHHFLIESIFASAQIIPIDGFVMGKNALDMIVRIVTVTMIVAVKIASPVLVALFLTNLSLALLSRVAPQMNIFALSMHVKIVVGLLSLFVSVPLIVLLMKHVLGIFESEVMKVLLSIA